jgi:outer membrane protein
MLLRNLTKVIFIFSLVLIFAVPGFSQKLKIGYVHSQKILADYKEAQDAQKKLDEINRQWENEGLELQQKLQQLREQFDAQSLLLSDAKKKEKQQEMETLYLQIQKFQRDKWDPQGGEILKKQAELIQPIYDKINDVIKKIGDDQKYDFIFDSANGGILYAGETQTDLTEDVLAELNKGLTVKTEEEKDKGK